MSSIKKVKIEVKPMEPSQKMSKLRKKRVTDLQLSKQLEREMSKEEICQHILKEGYVQSYIDFFYLTHRMDPHAGLYDFLCSIYVFSISCFFF